MESMGMSPQAQVKQSSVFSRNAWIAGTFIPIGWLAWAAFLYAGVRVKQRKWIFAAVAYFVVTTVWVVMIGSSSDDDGLVNGIGVGLCFAMWVFSIVHALVIRKEFVRRLDLRIRVEDSQLDREIALDLARDDPQQALQLGIGRPDLPGAETGGVVDVNHASVTVLATLPGIDDRVARQIAGTREAMGPFSSVAELGMVLDLPPHTVERLRPLVVFLR